MPMPLIVLTCWLVLLALLCLAVTVHTERGRRSPKRPDPSTVPDNSDHASGQFADAPDPEHEAWVDRLRAVHIADEAAAQTDRQKRERS